MRLPRLFRFLIPLALLLTAMPAKAATEQYVLDPSITFTLNQEQDTPMVCAASLLHNAERAKAGQDASTAVIDAYADKAKLTPDAKGRLFRDCWMFDLGVLFNITVNKAVAGPAEEDDTTSVPGYNTTVEKHK